MMQSSSVGCALVRVQPQSTDVHRRGYSRIYARIGAFAFAFAYSLAFSLAFSLALAPAPTETRCAPNNGTVLVRLKHAQV